MNETTDVVSEWLNASPEILSMGKWLLLGGILSLAPALAVMTTSFVRISVVLGILRQGFAGGQFLPAQAMTALSLFLTLGVMAPVWQASYRAGYEPYVASQKAESTSARMTIGEAVDAGAVPLRKFMAQQIESAGNASAVDLITRYQSQWDGSVKQAEYYEDLSFSVLLPAYVLSELKVAFAIGFQLLIPFVVIDIVVASLISALSLTSLPAAWVTLPLKLLLFVLIDGWTLTVETLLNSIRPFSG